jgi:hypothetical protein
MMTLLICTYVGGLVGFVLGAAWASRPADEAETRGARPRFSF